MAETNMKLNLVIDKNSQKVVYAEAGKDFIDFLFNLLTLPVGTVIMQLTEKGMVGCLGDLYQSVESLSETYMQPNQIKPILKPILITSSYCTLPTTKKFYICSKKSRTVAHYPSAVCPFCHGAMDNQAIYIFSDTEKAEGGYVKGAVTYMVTDALVVKPLSTMSIVDLLNKSNINEVGGELEEKVVDFTICEVCNQTSCSFFRLNDQFEAADKRIPPVENCLDECLPWESRPGIKSYHGITMEVTLTLQ